MSQEFQQSAITATQTANAAIASGATVGAGLSTYLELVPAVFGSMASLAGLVLSCVLIHTHLKKGRLERKQLRLQIAVLEQKEAKRKGESR